MVQNLWDTVNAVLRGRYIGIQAYLKSKKNLNLTPKGIRKRMNKAQGE